MHIQYLSSVGYIGVTVDIYFVEQIVQIFNLLGVHKVLDINHRSKSPQIIPIYDHSQGGHYMLYYQHWNGKKCHCVVSHIHIAYHCSVLKTGHSAIHCCHLEYFGVLVNKVPSSEPVCSFLDILYFQCFA
jgi:hypothetical protein